MDFILIATPGESISSDFALGHWYPALKVAIAPGYDDYIGSPSDVALVTVSGATPDMPSLPVLTASQDQLSAGQPVTLVGYGDTEDALVNADEFGRRRSTAQTIAWTNAQFIGFEQSNGRGICHRDSGGPVLVAFDGKMTLAGVHSFAAGAGGEPRSGRATSTRVARFADFIAEGIEGLPRSLDCGNCVTAVLAPGNPCDPELSCLGSCANYLKCVRACPGNACVAACGDAQAYSAVFEWQRSNCALVQCGARRVAPVGALASPKEALQ